MAVETWKLTKDVYVLYTENAALEKPALAAGLRPMAVHMRNDRPFAKQFVGPREVVMDLARQECPFKPFSGPGVEALPERERLCAECHKVFKAKARNARFCSECAAARRKVRERTRHFRKRRNFKKVLHA